MRTFTEILEADYHVTLEDNRRDESIGLAAEKYAQQFASQPPAMTAAMKELFMTWLTGIIELDDAKARLIIEYVENYFASQPPAPVGKMWEDSCPFCDISPVMCKSCGETLPSPVTSLQGGYSELDLQDARNAGEDQIFIQLKSVMKLPTPPTK